MKRYIRLENGKIIDLEETKERITSNEYYTDYRDFELFYNKSCDTLFLNWKATCTEKCTVQKAGATHNGSIVFNYGSAKIVAEGDYIADLIMAGDLCKIKFNSEDYSYSYGTIRLDEVTDEELFDMQSGIESESLILLELYTPQVNDYILVWEKERGII